MRRTGALLRDAWRLGLPYFNSEERWTARLLLFVVLALNLGGVGLNVLLNSWNGEFFNSLQNKDFDAFLGLLMTWGPAEGGGVMPGFVAIMALYIPIACLRVYLRKVLQVRWRRWMTAQFTGAWLTGRAYYTIGLTPDRAGAPEGVDNPDQRIAEDVRDYVENALLLSITFLSKVVSLVSFAGILWQLSGSIEILGVAIPGYMLWLALIYAGAGTALTHLIGRKLVGLKFLQQRAEADFRYGLVRLRDNTEAVALSGGETAERAAASHRFGFIVANWLRVAMRELKLEAFTLGFGQFAGIFPLVISAPRYFSGAIPLGGMMKTAGAFSSVNEALSWFVDSYGQLAEWRAQIVRLTGFQQAVAAAQAAAAAGPIQATAADGALVLHDLTLRLPGGQPLLEHVNQRFEPGTPTIITGRSGSGKSTLFRAMAGIWPFGSGQVTRPPGRALFLPQRPYFPIGTLRDAITYPAPSNSYSDADVTQALTDAGLSALLPRRDQEEPWSQRLSGGEQQRLSLARALLLRPDWLFLDEATSALDPAGELEIYRTLQARLPATTVISITHREPVASLHEQKIALSDLTPRYVTDSFASSSPSGRGSG